MARYKHIDTSPRFLAVSLEQQLAPGTFEHALNHLLDHDIDLSHFDARFRNDSTGASAYPPAMLLKVVLFAYSRGLVSSRSIARACIEQVTFIALAGDSQPHFTTLANFISTLGDDIAKVFGAVLAICDRQGLLGHAMFAIDGVKLPSNAAKARSGTRADFERQATKLETAAKAMLARHREEDEHDVTPSTRSTEAQRVQRLTEDAAELRTWLATHPHDRRGPSGAIVKSNRTDNESAKMATDKGVIQGYTGVAAVDAKHQIIAVAQAHGTGSEQALLMPIVEQLAPLLTSTSLITADAGYHSKANLTALDASNIEALIADNQMRKRDERFKSQARHKEQPTPLHNKAAKSKSPPRYQPSDFTYDAQAGTCVCPAGKSLYRHGTNCRINDQDASRFQGAKRDCVPCDQRAQCLRHPDKTATRQVAFFKPKVPTHADQLVANMRRRIDSPTGRLAYGQRFATVEPVFGNLRYNKRLNRFTLRSRDKVNGQWQLFCLVHNIEKLANLRCIA
jgi:transposase